MNTANCHPLAMVSAVANVTSARFASLTYEAKGTGETARHTILLGASVENAYRADLETLKTTRPTLSGVHLEACDELIASLEQSLAKGIGNNDAYTCANTYTTLAPGIKAHKATGEVYVSGMSIAKVVLRPGTYKKVHSSAKTLAKKELEKNLKKGKIRTFSIDTLQMAKIDGETLIFE